MENNRRSFFKGLAAFASGVVAAKASSYIPKKEEPKEELLVSSNMTFRHEGVDYHPLVVKKTDKDKMELIQPDSPLTISGYKATIRKVNV
jgi:hypothetical protein